MLSMCVMDIMKVLCTGINMSISRIHVWVCYINGFMHYYLTQIFLYTINHFFAIYIYIYNLDICKRLYLHFSFLS